MADVFADFYERLFSSRDAEATVLMKDSFSRKVEPVTTEEIRKQLGSMSDRKSPDASGVVAELLKSSSLLMLQAVADFFNDILEPAAFVPDGDGGGSWAARMVPWWFASMKVSRWKLYPRNTTLRKMA